MPRGQAKRSPYIRAAAWEPHRQEICELYETKPLEKVQAVMKRRHGFDATISQYKRQLGIWKVAKNSRASDRISDGRATVTNASFLAPQINFEDTCCRFALFSAGQVTLDEGEFDVLLKFKDLCHKPWLVLATYTMVFFDLESMSLGSLMVFFTVLAMLGRLRNELSKSLIVEGFDEEERTTWVPLVLVIMQTEMQAMSDLINTTNELAADREASSRKFDLTAENISNESEMVQYSLNLIKSRVLRKYQRVWQHKRSMLDVSWCIDYLLELRVQAAEFCQRKLIISSPSEPDLPADQTTAVGISAVSTPSFTPTSSFSMSQTDEISAPG